MKPELDERASARILEAVRQRAARFDLSVAETHVLFLAATGVPRSEIAAVRGVAPSTVKKQVQSLLWKVDAKSLEQAANALLVELVARELGTASAPPANLTPAERAVYVAVQEANRRGS
jgi:DNA-binding CsgD family transcriptional regulator